MGRKGKKRKKPQFTFLAPPLATFNNFILLLLLISHEQYTQTLEMFDVKTLLDVLFSLWCTWFIANVFLYLKCTSWLWAYAIQLTKSHGLVNCLG